MQPTTIIPSNNEDLLSLLRQLIAKVQHEHGANHPESASASASTSTSTSSLQELAYQLCQDYPELPAIALTASVSSKTLSTSTGQEESTCMRQNILLTLAECVPDITSVEQAVKHWNQSMEATVKDPSVHPSQAMERLRKATTPLYQTVFRSIYQQNTQLATRLVLSIRADLSRWMTAASTHPASTSTLSSSPVDLQSQEISRKDTIVRVKAMDQFLRDQILSQWFAPGLLQVIRIQYDQTPASLIEQMARHEAVHPVQSLKDLRERVGKNRRVFGLVNPLLPDQLLVVLHVALAPDIPASMNEVRCTGEFTEGPSPVYVACFYSISNLQPGLGGIGLGEYLIHQAVERLQQEASLQPTLETFCTLSPIPRFRKWLEQQAKQSGTTWEHTLLSPSALDCLAGRLECKPQESLAVLVDQLSKSEDLLHDNVVRDTLQSLVAHYLVHEKHRGRPLDAVARFHISNGALLYRINYLADTSRKGMANSYGIMVNYQYDLDRLGERRARFERDNTVPVYASVRALLSL